MNDRPMKLSFLLPDLRGGGAQRMIINMANEFSSRGYTVYLMIVEDIGPFKIHIHERIRIRYFHCSRAQAALLPLVRALYTARPDILYAAMPYMNFLAIAAKFLSGQFFMKLIISERNYFSLNARHEGTVRFLIQKFMMALFYPFADKIIGISKGVADDVKKHLFCGQAKVGWIHNPVISSETMDQLSLECMDRWFENRARPIFVTSGRLVAQKDQKTLLLAFSEFLKQKNGSLLILGEGPLRDDLEGLANRLGITKHILFRGFVPSPLSYMKKADVFVLSSAWEGFCNVLVEALLCGLPVVSTDCPSGPSEILDGGHYGALVPVGDHVKLAKAMETAAEQKADSESQVKRAMDFSVEKICNDYEDLFRALSGKGA